MYHLEGERLNVPVQRDLFDHLCAAYRQWKKRRPGGTTYPIRPELATQLMRSTPDQDIPPLHLDDQRQFYNVSPFSGTNARIIPCNDSPLELNPVVPASLRPTARNWAEMSAFAQPGLPGWVKACEQSKE